MLKTKHNVMGSRGSGSAKGFSGGLLCDLQKDIFLFISEGTQKFKEIKNANSKFRISMVENHQINVF